jgi:hypothetical protein
VRTRNEQTKAFGEVCLKIGQLYLSANEPGTALRVGLQAMGNLEKHSDLVLQISAIELVCRCYEMNKDWQSYQ